MSSFLLGSFTRPLAAAIVFLPFGPAAPPTRAATGVSFATATTVTLSSGLHGMLNPLAISGHGIAMPGKARVELDKVENAAGVVIAGDILLVPGSSPTVAIRPSLKTYADLTAPLQDQLNALTAEAGDGVRAGDVPARFTRVGAGEQIEGRATQRYQLKTTYVAEAPGHSVNVNITVDVWTAKLAFPVNNPLLAFGTASDTHIGAFRHKLASAFAALGDGTPVKTVITTGLAVGENAHEVVQTTTLSDIKPATVDPALLALPTGYSASAR
jgi:hypothetical protein